MTVVEQWFEYNRKQSEIQLALETALKQVQGADMTLNEFNLLHYLMKAEKNELLQSDIGLYLPLSVSAISRMLAKLEAKDCGSIRREKCDDDKRATYVVLTARGVDWYQKALVQVNQVLEDYQDFLGN